MRTIVLASVAILTALPSLAVAQGVTGVAARNVALELRENGRVVASSNVRLQLGRPAAIAVDGPYAVRLRVDAVSETGRYRVRPNLSTGGPGGWTQVATPAMSVACGERGRVVVERPSGPPLELAVSVD